MRLTKYTHSCIRIEEAGGVLVIDPGEFSEPEALNGADAVLITHEHPDHLDTAKLAALVGQRPSVAVYTSSAVAVSLENLGDAVHRVAPGDRFTAAGFPVRVYGGLHALIHPELPRVPNLAFFVEPGGIYHPGDSFDVPPDAEIDTLFVPVSAPWLKIAEAVEFVRQIAPRRAYPLHDGVLSEAGHGIVTGGMQRLCRCEYTRLRPGTSI
jgi:L-ascorbate metabolism protein UlaG (beta-lactamase superfamily)